jgi:preprotein translocase subunit SecB
MSDAGQNPANEAANEGAQPQVAIMAQYIKDLSFENPGAPALMSQGPQIDLGVDLQARRGDTEHFEVELKLRVTAKHGDKTAFLLELSYAGLFRIAGVPDEMLQPLLLIQAPHMLFPFARRIVADVVRDGGMPPLMVDPIDFAGLYQSKLASGAIQGGVGGTPVGTA